MNVLGVDRAETYFDNAFISAYLNSDTLAELYTAKPEIQNLENLIADRTNFSTVNRSVLVKTIRKQYQHSGIEVVDNEPLDVNLERLSQSNCLTITTGQQIHLGMGPLYVLYKILNTIQLAKEATEAHSQYQFVPVFWMATEDHDLEEIQTISLFGKEFTWQTNQKGPVGRMNCDGIQDLLNEMESAVNLDEGLTEFIQIAKKAYSLSTLADAHRYLVHHYFGKTGLVVLDADEPELKEFLKEVVDNELEGKHYKALLESTNTMENLGFEAQIHIRKINLFLFQDHRRYRVSNSEKEGTISPSEVTNYADISPNVALRPLYQETILPNVVYVGGPSETKYWGQLKGLFDFYDKPMPLVFVRSNCVVLPAKKVAKIEGLDLIDFFKPEDELFTKYGDVNNGVEELDDLLNGIKDKMVEYQDLFHKKLTNYSIANKAKSIEKKLDSLGALHQKLLMSKEGNNTVISRLLSLREHSLIQGTPQERKGHIVSNLGLLSELTNGNLSQFGFINSQKVNLFVI